MTRSASITVLAVGLLLLPPPLHAEASKHPARDPGTPPFQASRTCSTLGLSTLRGTYAFTGTAWQDLSEINPALPKGYAPVSIVGVFAIGGNGAVTGWALVNAGGVQMTTEFVNSQAGAPRADCSVPVSLSMRIAEFGGVVTGPYQYVGVVAGDGSPLEIHFMMLGTGPGSHVELNHATRISTNAR